MSRTTHIGFGPFQLKDFEPGDLFARFDGSLARVCKPQSLGRPDHIQVVTDLGTSNAQKVWLHKTAQAYAVSEEQAWSIEEQKRGASC